MSDLATLIRRAVKSGRLNYLSLAFTSEGLWQATFRGVDDPDMKTVLHKDEVTAITAVLNFRPPAIKPPIEDEDILV